MLRRKRSKEEEEEVVEAFTAHFCDAIQNKLGRIKNAASLFVDSDIIPKKAKQDKLEEMLTTSGINELKLLYRGTKDGMSVKAFHDKCDGWKGPTLTLVRTSKDYVFGGYAGTSRDSPRWGHHVTDPSCFVFNVVNPWNDPITKMPVLKPEYAMWCSAAYGPYFPGAFGICNRNWDPEGLLDCGYSYFDVSNPYGDPLGRREQTFVDDPRGDFTPVEIEVFAVAVPLC